MRSPLNISQFTILLFIVLGLLGAAPNQAIANNSINLKLSATSQKDDPELAEALQLTEKAIALYALGKYVEATPLAERALTLREKVLGANHADVAQSLNNLALIYYAQGQYPPVEALYQRALAILERLGIEDLSFSNILNNLALLYQQQGKYSQAETTFQRSLAIEEKFLGANHPEIATTLNNLASLYRNQGKYAQAETLYQRALVIIEKAQGSEHSDLAISLNNLAELYREQGKYSQAEPLYHRALKIFQKSLNSDHPFVAATLNNLGLLYYTQGKYSQAEPSYQQALTILEKVLGAEHPNTANILNNLANLYQEQGKYSQAEPLYQRTLKIRQKALGTQHPSVAESLSNLGLLYDIQGKYTQAELLYQQALDIREKLLGAEHPDVAQSLNNMASLYRAQGKYNQAEPLEQRALAIRKKALGTEHQLTAASLNNLASIYELQGKYPPAETLYQQSLAIIEKVLGANHPKTATSLNNLAGLYYNQGKYAQAEPLYQRSLAIRQQVLGTEHPEIAQSLNNLGALYYSQGKYAEAETALKQASAIFEKTFGLDHPNTAQSLTNLARLYSNQGDIKQGIEFFTRALNIEEKNLALNLGSGSETDKLAYINTFSRTTNWVVSLHLQTAPNHPAAIRLALTTILQRKGRVLDVLADSLQALRRNLTPENQVFLDQLAANRAQLSSLMFNKPANLPLNEYRSGVAILKAEIERLEGELSRRSAQFRVSSQPVTIEAVQKLIPTDAALVELVFYQPYQPKVGGKEQPEKPRYGAYILRSQGEPQWLDVGEAKAIDKVVQEFRTAVVDTRQKTKAIQTGRTLDALLMQPIRQKLGNVRQILLSPDSQLNLIPFAALVDENNRYLVENYNITYLATGRDLFRLANRTTSQQQPVVLANPDFDNSGKGSQATSARGEGMRSVDLTNFQFSALPGTAAEAQELAPLLPNATILTGAEATETVLKQVRSPSILHIATHGFFLQDVPLVAPPGRGGIAVEAIATGDRPSKLTSANLENPLLRSGLVLAGFNLRQSGAEDGVLTALEAAGLNLIGTKLLVLSACQTGLGDIANGEGVYGLRRAFAIAGVESQVMSLWYVSDAGTKELMVKYYQRLLKKEGRSEALRQTQLEMLQSPTLNHPYFWAAFIPSGDWTPAQF